MAETLTLIGENMAKKGMKFIYLGPAPECRDCKMKNVCLTLEAGKMYEIKEVRDTSHECKIHNGKVRAVKVEKKPVEAVLPTKQAVEGSLIKYSVEECPDMTCPYYDRCHSLMLKDGAKYKITEIKKDIKCPSGKSMKLVLLE